MAELIMGKNLILFFREYALRATQDGAKLRFQTEHSMSFEKETEATSTKDGIINTISDGENTVDITSLAYVDDTETTETWKELRDMFKRNALVEIWEVDITNATADTLAVEPLYIQGYFTSFEISAPADGQVELSYSFAVNGNGVTGEDTLTAEQLTAVQSTLYEYQSIQATGTGV